MTDVTEYTAVPGVMGTMDTKHTSPWILIAAALSPIVGVLTLVLAGAGSLFA